MKDYYLVILILVLILFSCNRKEVPARIDLKVIDAVFDESKILTTLDIDDYFDINSIPLETKDESLIGKISKVSIHDNKVLVLDKSVSKSLIMFSLEGKYLRKIGKIGKGEGEFINIQDFDVFENNIYILSALDRKFLIYDFNGNLIKEIRTSEHPGYAIKVLTENSFMTLINKSIFKVCFWNNKGQVVNCIEDKKYDYFFWSSIKGISTLNDTSYVNTPFCDTIFRINEKELEPAYVFDFGTNKYPLEQINNIDDLNRARKSGNYIKFSQFVNTPEILLIRMTNKYFFYGVYFKNRSEFTICENLFYNKLPLSTLCGEFENGIIFSVEPSLLIKSIKNDVQLEKNININSLSPENNPILLVLTNKC